MALAGTAIVIGALLAVPWIGTWVAAAGLVLGGLGLFLAWLIARREWARAGAARARDRLARLGLLAGTLAQEIQDPLQEMREGLLRLREQIDELPPWTCTGFPFELCDALSSELDRLEGVMRHFLASARPESAPPRIVDAALLVRDWALAIEPELAARDLAIAVDGAATPAVAIADHEGLKQVFWSLVRNARDAAPRGSIVHVLVRRDSERVRIRVADCGPGIPFARREEIFEPLVSTKPEGLGLGLAVARHLAEAMGATLSVEGGHPGATFEVALRRAPQAMRHLARMPARARS